MIRFINLDNQIEDNESAFSFYDTIDDNFVSLDGYVVFDTVETFTDLFNQNGYKDYALRRFTDLMTSTKIIEKDVVFDNNGFGHLTTNGYEKATIDSDFMNLELNEKLIVNNFIKNILNK